MAHLAHTRIATRTRSHRPVPFFARLGLAALALATVLAAQASQPMAGVYIGGFGKPGAFVLVRLELKASDDGQLEAKLQQPFNVAGNIPVQAVQADGARIRFTAQGAAYDLTRTGLGYAGVVTLPQRRPQKITLVDRTLPPKPEVLATYEGTYDLGGGRTLTLSRSNAGSTFWWLELPSGRTGSAMNVSGAAWFVTGECMYCADPVYRRIDIVPKASGPIAAIRVTAHGRSRLAPRLRSVREETLRFASADGTVLEGTLFLPTGPGIHPALAMLHGSGAQSRNGFYGHIRFLSEAYARAGIAVLAYDKRGVGGSKGDWETASLDLLAQDGAAAVRALQARGDIDPQRIGMTGSSQAAWIIPMALRHVDGVALMQMRSGSSPMGVEESEWRRLPLQMRGEGFSQEEIDRALVIRRKMDEYTKTGQGWDDLEASFKAIEGELWAGDGFLGGLPARDAPDWPWLREAFGVDTTADFARYRGPLQFLYGEVDFVPTAQARPMLEQALGPHLRDPDVSIAVWPGANHNYLAATSAAESELPGLSRFVPGFYECVTGWAAEQFGLKPRGSATRSCPRDATAANSAR
jgi:dienelactone hydrolase